jgi:hypothetical protein
MPTMPAILLVEQDRATRDRIRSYLDRLHYPVFEAANADAALRTMSREWVDILLGDLPVPMPPDLRGLFRERPAIRRLPIAAPRGAAPLHRIGRLLGACAIERNLVLRRAYDYWAENARRLNPRDIKDMLPDLAIAEIARSAAGTMHRYRFVGRRIIGGLGHDPTGRAVESSADRDGAALSVQLLRHAAQSRQPLYAASPLHDRRAAPSTERLFLPFGRDGEDIREILIAQSFDELPRGRTIHDLAEEPLLVEDQGCEGAAPPSEPEVAPPDLQIAAA